MNVIKKKLSELKPLEKNVRKHGEKQIGELIKSLKQFGQTRAIVVDEDNNILIGNGLYMAMNKQGYEECDVFVKSGLSEKDKKKLVLSDNKIFSLGQDDFTNLQEMIESIVKEDDFDIAGFDEDVLKSFVTENVQTIMDDYGKISDGDLPNPVSVTQKEDETDKEKIESYGSETDETADVPIVSEDSSDKRRSVICPNCGEVIYFD